MCSNKYATILVALFSLVWLTGAGWLPLATGGGVVFTGIGDVKTGWTAAWGTRAFSAATRGNKLINACDSTGGTDVACADMLSDATTGDIVPKVIGGITCPNANCTVKIYYDISGATNCSAAACDLSQAAVGSRATLTANAIGTKTCGVGTSGGNFNGSFGSLAQPLTVSAVVKYAITTGNHQYFGASGGGGTGMGTNSGTFQFFSSSSVTAGATDTSPHAFQNVDNSASSFIVTDTSTSSTQSSGGTTLTTQLGIFSDSFTNHMNGAVCEVGLYPAAFSGADATNMYNNQHVYWGF